VYPTGVRPATNNVLMRRDLFNALGGYDTRFTEGAEDADFFDRVAAAGHRLWFEPGAEALHLIPARRLELASLRWTSLRIGAGDARLEQRKLPGFGPMRLAALRIGVALVRDLPQLALAGMRRDQRAELDVRCSLWYTEGLLRALPGILSREQDSEFLRSLNFRARNGERSVGRAKD
jgi:GT2 family glycosyltransferase